MAFSSASGTNTSIPSAAATDGLIVGFSRSVADFAVNRWVGMVPVDKPKGFYINWDSNQSGRIGPTDGSKWQWAYGADRPVDQGNNREFAFSPYFTERLNFSSPLPIEAEEFADFDIGAAERAKLAQQCMTMRTAAAVGALTNAPWGANNSANVDGVAGINGFGAAAMLASGQNWTNGTVNTPNIKLTLLRALKAINLGTLGRLQPRDLTLVITPDLALLLAMSPEVQDALKQSQFAMGALTGENPDVNGLWGMPPMIAGMRIVVEDTVLVTTEKGAATPVQSYAFPAGSAYLVIRPGGLVQPPMPWAGGRVFSTVTMFSLEEMTVERRVDTWNRIIQDSITSNFDMRCISPAGGFQFTHAAG